MAAGKSRRWLIVAGACTIIAGAVWWVLHPWTHDPYPFLAGHRVADVSVLGPGSWPASETRAYTWRQPWRSVADRARRDLPAYGLAEQPKSKYFPESADWMGEIEDGGPCGKNSDTTVSIMRGRLLPLPLGRRDSYTDDDPEWVTVFVQTFLPETWVNVVRYTFFSLGD